MTDNKYTSIKTRITIQFSSLIAVSVLLMIAFVIYFVTNHIKNDAEISLQNRADIIQNKIEYRLEYLIENTNLFAKNELMINALIDDDGRKEYLTPLINNFKEDKNVLALNVVDFEGKAIFKTEECILKYSTSKYLRRSLSMGETTYYLNQNNNHMVVISPIKYYNTTQGSLIAKYDLNEIVNKYVPNDSYTYIKLIKNDITVYSINFTDDEIYYSYVMPNDNSSIFNKLGIVLEIGVLESYYMASINEAIIRLFLLGLILLMIGIFGSFILSVSITDPIIKLYNRVRQKEDTENYEPLGTDDELEKLAEAFYEKTKKLQNSEKLYLDLYNNSPDMYVSVDEKTAKVISCNTTLVNKLGYSKEEIVGKEIFDLYHPDCMDDVHKAFESFVKTGNVNNAELQLKRKDGTKIYVLLNVSVVKDDDGNILHSNSTWRDISEIKEHEDEIKKNRELLYQQSKMASMGEMIGNISHQWRQPLSTITMSSANLRASIELGEKLTDDELLSFSSQIEKQCQYLSKTIDDFRSFFTPNKNKSEFTIKHTLKKTVELMSASFTAHEIEVIQDIEDIKITTFENELTQATLNIIKNAKDILLTLENRKRLIFIKAYKKNKTVFIEIKDSGGGVPQDIITKVFEPYFTTKHKSQGTGIGLYMTLLIIEKHLNGKVYVENLEYEYEGEKYTGAQFTIEIPLEAKSTNE